MRAVTKVVHRVAVGIGKVVAVDVVDVAVGVVVSVVARDFTRVGPHVGCEVRVGVVDAAVDDRNDDRGTARLAVPRFWRIDVGVDGTTGLTGVVHAPELVEQRVVRYGDRPDLVVRLGVDDVGRCTVGT